jgi:Ni,Fe-hydrogenase I large subunit
LRTIRSFDPCMPCAAHIMADDQLIVRDATSCACGVE